MKKYVAGFVAGIVFMLSASAFADTISLIGKKVTGEYKMVVDDKALTEKGAIIDNRANVPARALSEALGATVAVDYDTKTIFINSQKTESEEVQTVPDETVSNEPKVIPPSPNSQPRASKYIESEIRSLEIRLLGDRDGLMIMEEKLKSDPSESNKESYENLKKIISDNEARLVELNAELEEAKK